MAFSESYWETNLIKNEVKVLQDWYFLFLTSCFSQVHGFEGLLIKPVSEPLAILLREMYLR